MTFRGLSANNALSVHTPLLSHPNLVKESFYQGALSDADYNYTFCRCVTSAPYCECNNSSDPAVGSFSYTYTVDCASGTVLKVTDNIVVKIFIGVSVRIHLWLIHFRESHLRTF
jgi:hypothetical protein